MFLFICFDCEKNVLGFNSAFTWLSLFFLFLLFQTILLGASAGAKSSTLPLPHRLNVENKQVSRDRGGVDGYYR